MKKIVMIFVVAATAAASIAEAHPVRFAVFANTKRIDPDKLVPIQAGRARVDLKRRVIAGSVQLFSRVAGASIEPHAMGLELLDPESVDGLTTLVRMIEASPPVCSDGSVSEVAFVTGGRFFNDGSGSAFDQTGDVIAAISVVKSSTQADGRIWAIKTQLERCADPLCGTSEVIAPPEQIGTTRRGGEALLSVLWDEANDRFMFRLNHGAPIARSYVLSDSAAAIRPERSFYVLQAGGCAVDDASSSVADFRVREVWTEVMP